MSAYDGLGVAVGHQEICFTDCYLQSRDIWSYIGAEIPSPSPFFLDQILTRCNTT